jgi:hypothetical protein
MQIYRLWLAGNDKFCEDDASAENDKNKVLPCVLTSAPLLCLGPTSVVERDMSVPALPCLRNRNADKDEDTASQEKSRRDCLSFSAIGPSENLSTATVHHPLHALHCDCI